jgi:hypothetical protein
MAHVGVVIVVAAGSNWQLFRWQASPASRVFRALAKDSAH